MSHDLETRVTKLLSYFEDLVINIDFYGDDSDYYNFTRGDVLGKLRSLKSYLKVLQFDTLVAELDSLDIDENGIVFTLETIREFIIPETRRYTEEKKLADNAKYAPDVAQVTDTPFLSKPDIANASKMSELYIILHCYENSVRAYIEKVLSADLGEDWWNIAATTQMKNIVENRKETEKKRKWLSPRGNTLPLYYLDWSDLVKLIRKYEHLFVPKIGELRFIESRFEDLESLRNIVAHHGVLPSEDDFHRVIISFRDWCRQIGKT